MWFCKWSLWGYVFCVLACTAPVRSPALPEKKPHGKAYWAKQSFYGGIFFDDDRYGFLSPIAFEKLTCLKSISGDYIIPPPAHEVISFGTRVNIQKIEWPTAQNRMKRPLLTPRLMPWIYLTVALDRGSVRLDREKTYVMLVPERIRSEEALFRWFSDYFSQEDNNLFFLNLSSSEQEAILKP